MILQIYSGLVLLGHPVNLHGRRTLVSDFVSTIVSPEVNLQPLEILKYFCLPNHENIENSHGKIFIFHNLDVYVIYHFPFENKLCTCIHILDT